MKDPKVIDFLEDFGCITYEFEHFSIEVHLKIPGKREWSAVDIDFKNENRSELDITEEEAVYMAKAILKHFGKVENPPKWGLQTWHQEPF